MESSGMRNTVLQISGATLQRVSKVKPSDLTWGYLEEQLREYYKEKGTADETEQVLTFLQSKRGGKTVEYLKKSLADKSGKNSTSV